LDPAARVPQELSRGDRRLVLAGLAVYGCIVAALLLSQVPPLVPQGSVAAWLTIFLAVTVQALPFLVLGVLVSGAIAAFVPSGLLGRRMPARPIAAVPMAGLAGAALPGCECGAVPIAGRLVAGGVPPAAALTFLLSAPAINPIVLVSTAVAFPGRPEVVLARFLASFATAVVVGLVWSRLGREEWVARARAGATPVGSRWAVLTSTAAHDFLHAGGFLVVGAMVAATLQVVVPRSLLDGLAGSGVAAVATMAFLAVALAICSEADAFVAASLSQFSLTSRLVFLVVGPAVDVKLVALQAGIFGRPFAARFAPFTLGVAVLSAVLVGWWLL
jgi:uncharacterized protein